MSDTTQTNLADALTALVSSWNAVQSTPGGPRVLRMIFGSDLSGGTDPAYSIASTPRGLARPVEPGLIDMIPALVAQAVKFKEVRE